MQRFDQDMDGSMEPEDDGRWVRYEDTTRLRSVNAQMLEALRQTTMLRQLGGMLPGVRETIVMVLESVDAAIAAAEAK